MDHDKEYVLKLAHENNVKFIRLWFTDVLGLLKNFAITVDELEDALLEGVRFDGSTLNGYIRLEEQELIALPDPSTFQILPWRPQEASVARMFCDIYTNDMVPHQGDSRYILKQNLKKAAAKGYTFYTGPEIEFFFFNSFKSPEILDVGGYFDQTPLDGGSDYRRQTVLTLEQMGIGIISSHHEGANSQHEIDLRHEDALTTADNIMTFRLATKEIALQHGIYASFMPKPLALQNGSGMHIHQSLFREDANIFYDAKHPRHLSKDGEYYIAGLLKHSREFFAVTNQWINSYKRFVKGYEAPTSVSWSDRSSSALVRIPIHRKDKINSMRVELRNPDPACNPYLVLSVILASGLKGLENKYELPAPIENDSKKKNTAGTTMLPTHLGEALDCFKASSLMRETLGDYITDLFIENKLHEIERFNSFVTDFEITEYLPKL